MIGLPGHFDAKAPSSLAPRVLESLRAGHKMAGILFGQANGRAMQRDDEAASTCMRFPSAVKRDAAIDVWLSAQTEELRGLARPWFARMRACGDDVRELMHDGCPVACVEDTAFGYVNV